MTNQVLIASLVGLCELGPLVMTTRHRTGLRHARPDVQTKLVGGYGGIFETLAVSHLPLGVHADV